MLLYEQRSAGSSLAAPVLDKKLDILILLFSMSFSYQTKKARNIQQIYSSIFSSFFQKFSIVNFYS